MVIGEQRSATTPVLGAATIEEFRSTFHGTVIMPGDTGYDDARRLFNGMIDRRPALIARCADTHDVARAVRLARSHGLDVAVHGGGHSVAGYSTIDGGIMIDLSPMKSVVVDRDRQIATAGAGLRLGEYIVETEKHGFVTPVGTVSDTGLAGLALGGGYGWLSGKYGMTVDNIVGAEVVTADGRVVQANADENPDLFWGLRGGSGNFGVVTSFDLKLYPLTQVLGGLLVHPFERASEVLRYFRQVASSAPDELTLYSVLATVPDGQKVIMIGLCYAGPIDAGEQLIAPIREFGPPLVDLVRPMPYSEINTLMDDAIPSGLHNYWKWNGLKGVTDEVIDIVTEHFARVPSPHTAIMIDQLHGAASRVPSDATAFAHRDAPHGLVVLSMWPDPADTEANITWTRELAAATAPYSTGGVYVNSAAGDKAEATYGSNYQRLSAIKAKYDPTNFFRSNQNIKPAS